MVLCAPELLPVVLETTNSLGWSEERQKKGIVIAFRKKDIGSHCPPETNQFRTLDDLLDNTKELQPHSYKDPKEELAYLCYSSGTTGLAKGVMTTGESLAVCDTPASRSNVEGIERLSESVPLTNGPVSLFPLSANNLVPILSLQHDEVSLRICPLNLGSPCASCPAVTEIPSLVLDGPLFSSLISFLQCLGRSVLLHGRQGRHLFCFPSHEREWCNV